MKQKIIVVGAGIIGATTALAMAEQGYSVDVIEQSSSLGVGTSGDNGAQLSYNYTDAMASPDLLKSLAKLLLGRDPSFRLVPHLDWDYLKWGLQFLSNCRQSKSDINTLSLLEIALQSAKYMHDWIVKYQFDFDFNKSQKLHLYESSKAFKAAQHRATLKNDNGGNQVVLSAAETLSIEPSLSEANIKLVGSILSPDDEVGDVKKFTKCALAKAFELGGGQLFLDTKVTSFSIKHNCCDSITTCKGVHNAEAVVLCTGYQSQKLIKKLGLFEPIIPVAGYSLTYKANSSSPNISLTDTQKKIVLCKLGNNLRVAGMADMGRVVSQVPVQRLATLITILQQRFPRAADYNGNGNPWAGMRPMTPNSLPIVKQLNYKNLFLNSGHGMLGWTLAASSAQKIKHLISKSDLLL